MTFAHIEQFDALGAVRQFFVRRRRDRFIETVRDNANAVFFADLAEQHRLDQRKKRADRIRTAMFADDPEMMLASLSARDQAAILKQMVES